MINKTKHKQNLINLYQMSFDDGIEYVNYFFDNFYKQKNCINIYKNGKCVSALHLVDKKISFLGKSYKCPYIFAASTLKEFQNKGYFGKVLQKSLKKLYKRKVSLCALYPFEHSFYQKFGFATICYVKNAVLNFYGEEIAPPSHSSFSVQYLLKIYNNYFKDFDVSIIRDIKEMQKKVDECLICGGKICFFENSYILYDKAGSETVLNSDIKLLNRIPDLNNLTVQTYSRNFDVPYTMTRIVNAKKLLKSIPYNCSDNSIKLKINDDFLKSNDVTLEIFIKEKKARVKECKEFDEKISISDLTKLVFGAYKKNEFSKKLTDIFPNKKTYLIDQI